MTNTRKTITHVFLLISFFYFQDSYSQKAANTSWQNLFNGKDFTLRGKNIGKIKIYFRIKIIKLKVRIDNLIKNRQIVKDRFLRQIDNSVPDNTYQDKRDDEFVKKAVKFVEDNMASNNLSRKTFAAHMFVSESILFQKLKTLTGQSPSEFTTLIRLRKAATLLIEDKLSLLEIINVIGYTDTKYFSTSFKKCFKKTPTEYKKDHTS